jgi:hypothetical protein
VDNNNDDDDNNKGIRFMDFRGREKEDKVVSGREEEDRVVFRGREGEEEEEEEDITIAV